MVVYLDTIFDLRNDVRSGILSETDYNMFRTWFQNDNRRLKDTFPTKMIVWYKIFWGDNTYPANCNYICAYGGNKTFWYGFTISGGTLGKLQISVENKTWAITDM